MGKKITGNAGEVFSIKSNDETRYLLRADTWSYSMIKFMRQNDRLASINYETSSQLPSQR